ncbi:hypothetical protein HBB16_12655 [Pseudonocardia sp. MCCB 268]|nr:hypothetical protein [Pseudonocardia cytotoxica]
MLLRIPVGFAGSGSSAAVGPGSGGTPVLLGVFETALASAVTEHALVAILLFLLMAQFIPRSGVADQMSGRRPGLSGGRAGGARCRHDRCRRHCSPRSPGRARHPPSLASTSIP